MQNVPKIVADRLGTAPLAVNHPDADVLTAFSERSLPDGERATVLEHLARCGDCREVVALALPAAEAVDQAVRPVPSGWLTWPVLRWGFITAGIAAIASFAVLQYQRHAGPTMMARSLSHPEAIAKEAKNEAPPIPAASEPAKVQDKEPAPPVPAAAGATVRAKPSVAAPKEEFDRLEAFSRLQKPETHQKTGGIGSGGSVGGPLRHGPEVQYQNLNSFQNSNNAVQNNAVHGQNAPAPMPYAKQAPNAWIAAGTPAPSTSQTVQDQGQNPQLDMQGQNQQALILESKAMPLQPTEGGQGHTVEPAKEPGVVLAANTKVPARSLPPPSSTLSLQPPSASWTISAGALQRSLDQGKTWQSVDVNPAPAAGANYAFAAPIARAKAADTKNDTKKDGTADTNKGVVMKAVAVPMIFRAVAANGADVWAGGSSGLLYHSTDSGAHWIRVLPFSGGAILTGDVVSVDFPDALHGRVATSTPEVWLTSDAGQTWQKQ